MQEWEVPIYTKSESMVMQALTLKKKIKRLKRELMLGQIVTLTTYKKPTILTSHAGGSQMVKKQYMIVGLYDNYILCQSMGRTPWKECFSWDHVAREVFG